EDPLQFRPARHGSPADDADAMSLGVFAVHLPLESLPAEIEQLAYEWRNTRGVAKERVMTERGVELDQLAGGTEPTHQLAGQRHRYEAIAGDSDHGCRHRHVLRSYGMKVER